MRHVWKWGAVLLGLVALGFVGAMAFSPYRSRPGTDPPSILEAVEIEASCPEVHAYLGDSSNARDWSVYVDHITPLNTDQAADGAEGSIRRSFRNADETGMRWDEYFEHVEPGLRRLTVYNIVGAPSTRGALVTEQIYEPLGPGRCRLAFSLFLREDASLGDAVLMRLAAWDIARIFRSNIRNVKAEVEAT
ncbi:MAG: SRPBCC family protein [Gemmatimonadota bacterium]|jgi:hypothetical protein